jgi:hypothetical protein
VLDWDGIARQNPSWLQPDGIHLTPSGAEGMAGLIEDAHVGHGGEHNPMPAQPRRLLSIASRALPKAHEGRRYAVALRAVGGRAPYRWSRTAGSLAPGLRLAANGRLTGVPSRKGSFSLRVRVIDGTGTARARVLSLRVV